MNGINLIPAERRCRHQRRARIRLWITIAPICTSMLAGLYGYLAVNWETRTSDLVAKRDLLAAEVDSTKKEVEQDKADANQIAAALWANHAVAEQPDWGLLLALLAEKLDDQTVLSGVDVRPAEDSKGATAPKERVRPDRYTIRLMGYSQRQEGVSQFVLNLEKLGLFDSVVMKESRRTTILSADAVEFRVECAVSDPTGVGQ